MNVNVSYNGFSLADAASCVMMRLPVPDLVWDMEALWKVWNEPIPAITPEAVPEPAPEPEPKPDNTEAVRQAVTALPPKSNRYADEGNGRRLRDRPCELDGRQYTSLDTAAVILDLTLGEAYRQVMERGKFLKGRVK